MTCADSVVLTQTHPAAPYVCRTGNITLRCQYESVENVLLVQWISDGRIVTDPSMFKGHTETFFNSSYQEVVVDSYMNLMGNYSCAAIVQDGSFPSNLYTPKYECECLLPFPTQQAQCIPEVIENYETFCSIIGWLKSVGHDTHTKLLPNMDVVYKWT